MARDQSLLLRQAVITHLRGDNDLTDLVPEERVYGMRTPGTIEWPFTRYGTPDTTPQRATCWDGSSVNVVLHAFSKQDYEDEVADILAALVAALGDAVLTLDDSTTKAHFRWVGSTIVPDVAEASAWHGIARFEATLS